MHASLPERVISVLLAACFFSLASSAAASDGGHPMTLAERLDRARALSNLQAPGAPPFHLKAHFTIPAAPGIEPVRQGTLEETWAAPDRYRLTVTTDGAVSTVVVNGGKAYQEEGERLALLRVSLLEERLLRPVPSAERVAKATFWEKKIAPGGVPLTCIHVEFTSGRLPGSPAWCLSDNNFLRVSIDQSAVTAFNGVDPFGTRWIARSIEMRVGGQSAATLHVDELTRLAAVDESLFVPPPGAQPAPMQVQLAPGTTQENLVKKVPPIYPLLARQRHITGAVELGAVIDADGAIRDLQPISSPSPLLTEAALDAVRQWRYLPYTLNGSPVEVQTKITVHFNMGP